MDLGFNRIILLVFLGGKDRRRNLLGGYFINLGKG